ncbi:hypothetical protein BC835DRAFT_1278821 [Cytidiella melzeri]|nr:hypothetical protein BC835DRAFT_1278821 [Cytidiella melzeri]
MDPSLYITKRGQLPPVPQIHGTSSDTFRQPPLDGSLCMAEIYEWHAHNSPNHPVFQYLEDTGCAATITFKDAIQAIYRGGWLLRAAAERHLQLEGMRPTIAVIALSETISYAVTWLASQRAGFILFPISPRNSPAAVAHLLTQVSADLVLVGSESSMQELAEAAFECLRKSGVNVPPTSPMFVFDDLFPSDSEEVTPLPPIHFEAADVTVIMHSSGSTAFPKPIKWTFFRMITLARLPYYGEVDLTGTRIATHPCPMYHGMGLSQISWTGGIGSIITCHKPQTPPRVCTPGEMLHEAHALKSDLFFCTPNFPEAWAKNEEEVNMLKQTRGILFGGGPMAKETGDFLVSHGISLYSVYGCTEYGIMNTILPKSSLKDWEYFSFAKPVRVHWVPDENGTGNFKLILLAGELSAPVVINCMVDGVGGFDTNDLFIRHPSNPELWKIYGRADDQIMHSIGEKTNPGPLEAILKEDPHIAHVVMFGRGRFNVGVIVLPTPERIFDPADTDKLVAFRNKIWPTVDKMNRYAPQHSRLFKEMILVSSPNKPFTFTAKGTPRRYAVLDEYAPEIDALYAAVEESTQADIPSPQLWDSAGTTEFVRTVVNKVLSRPVSDSQDIFQHSCDSLQATWIRNSLLHALRHTFGVETRKIPINFVYDNPTVSGLAEYICTTVANRDQTGDRNISAAIQTMKDMLDKHSGDFPVHQPQSGRDQFSVGDTIVVTGTTGGLGSALLAHLASMPEVKKVYAINRKGRYPLRERQREVLVDRGYAADTILDLSKIVLVEADLSQSRLGLSQELYAEANSVTHIIHNAWPVNFNVNLSFFEPSIQGLRNLVDLALSSPHGTPPRIIFISSEGILRHLDHSTPILEQFVGADVAVGTGYSESKWISEQLLEIASRKTPLPSITLRVGQIAGSENGAWNAQEWMPSMIKSSIHLGCIPMLSETVSWLGVNFLADAVLEARNAPTHLSPIHLAHPRPVSWKTLFEPVAKRYNLQPVSFSTWFSKLAETAATTEDEHPVLDENPAVKLLSFYSTCNDAIEAALQEHRPFVEAMALPQLDVTKSVTVAAKESLSTEKLKSLGPDDMLRWLGYWERTRFLPARMSHE